MIFMKKILFVLFALLPVIARAQYWETHVDIDGIYYYLDRINKEAWVDDCRHFDNNTTVNIPATVEDKGKSYLVTRINAYAFKDHTEIINFTIPHSVRYIGKWAFENTGWYNAQPDGTYLYLDNWFIKGKDGIYYKKQWSVNIPEGIRGIAESALYGFDFITSITIPNSVLYINASAFSGCIGLTSITIPNSVTKIGDYAFEGCSKPTAINIPNSVISIDNCAFLNCSGLISITIGNSVTSIGKNAFSGCSNLTSVIVKDENSTYDSRNGCNAIIETLTNTLIAGCKNTTIPNSVVSIGEGGFSGCSGLTSIAIPNSVTNIGDYAFSDCKGLTSVIIGNSVSIHIGDYAFYNCDNIKDFYCYIETPPSLGFPGKYAFNYSYYARHKHTLHVPKNSVLKYKNSKWNDYFYSIVPLTGSDPTTGIKDPSSVESHSSNMYTLSGQRVTNPKRGIYIQGGRKVVIK